MSLQLESGGPAPHFAKGTGSWRCGLADTPTPEELSKWEEILRKEGLGADQGSDTREVFVGDETDVRASTADEASLRDFEEYQRHAERFDRRYGV